MGAMIAATLPAFSSSFLTRSAVFSKDLCALAAYLGAVTAGDAPLDQSPLPDLRQYVIARAGHSLTQV
ncbi:MAG: hypothetical protein MZV63_05510 [Marinilabiliales bacterium]|nr:hypothetical protein [Marinilabiliales bacterium]